MLVKNKLEGIMKYTHINIIFIVLLSSSLLFCRPWRPGQIPNGDKFSCSNCHINPNGGGARNNFGKAVEALVSPGSSQDFWVSGLAALDSDGDGVTNGQELGDPNGTWRPGQPNPGQSADVFNPGNSASKPSATSVENNTLVNTYKLYSNYPNPFNPSTTITYQIPRNEHVSLKIYNLLGQLISTLADDEKPAGKYSILWNGRDDANAEISSGVYIYKLTAGSFNQTKRMLLLK
jgi:hypothetical protein